MKKFKSYLYMLSDMGAGGKNSINRLSRFVSRFLK